MIFIQGWKKLTATVPFIITITSLILGSKTSLSTVSSTSITREECEADSSFVFIPPGEFILFSDRQ
ncbi:hypothetical protein H1P_210014 [Hyella patelloides LEGE 07179]|uniref:Uncharacterized protein n=1 Tax=Hyella patelloides LEGE 07179 TaxID=945734 RepID=A0A563VQC8_9CYAN|nr:hypothetical protein [Hyella patelloides]VEP13633.1 hypothetical protein H1P_210014 [Hyella patelloides LEGE 07179]